MTDPFDLLHAHPDDAQASSENAEVVLFGDPERLGPRMPMVVSVTGHTDAGTLSEQLADALLDGLPHKQVASFDVDELFDYRSRRPQVTFTENRFSDYRGPRLDLFEVRDASDRPFLLLTGDEPDFQWERVTETVLQLIEHLDVNLVVTVDALGLPTPHTRPIGVTAHGNRQDLIEGISTWSPNAQLEAGLSHMLELRVDAAGRDVVGYTLHVPHYLAGGKYPQVAVAALEYAGAACELMLPTDELREAARMVDADVSRQVSQAPEIAALVTQLEANFDRHTTNAPRSLLVKDDDAVPDAEELGAAVEAYLRTQPEDVILGSAEQTEQDGAPEQDTETDVNGESGEQGPA